ncbi:hypothetical protein [Actinokineospora sp. NBRC 105648]|uniref:hypothetical protein n=1 Tax=Actinokineospora sp. NBRC 105648 TaxID=3032206 RepID=UPI0025521AEE|nr:hypothetical protein [Actinokineospora sp. NBRC 105648]
MNVEVLRRFGGMAARALVGGEFVPAAGTSTAFEVGFVAESAVVPGACPSRQWSAPFDVGLIEEYAHGVLAGVTDSTVPLPPGVLRVAEAGIDEIGSSAALFRQAALVLRSVVAAELAGTDVESAVRTAMAAW